MIQPTDSATHGILLRYHGDIEMPAEGGHILQAPQTSVAEVERELISDEWSDLVTGNGNYVPVPRKGRNRDPEGYHGEDNR